MPMPNNQFEHPSDYARHLLTTKTPEDAIKHVIDTHGLKGRFWRDTIRILVDASA